jgi:hypothetical protein
LTSENIGMPRRELLTMRPREAASIREDGQIHQQTYKGRHSSGC